jgi:YD repeat-containing protein
MRSSVAPALDIRRAEDWRRRFQPGTLDRIVCEHVLEHMTHADGLAALRNFKTYLRRGGFARIAVPDALNPSPHYQNHCRPGGALQTLSKWFLYAADEPPHIVHYDFQTLCALITEAGLLPRLLEYHDAAGRFHRATWDVRDAPIRRFYNSPYNLKLIQPVFGYQNLSLIVDARKP